MSTTTEPTTLTETVETPVIDAPATPPAPSLMWSEDEPKEVEATTTKPESPAGEEAKVETPAEAPKPHDRDKAIIQLQQRQTTFEKQMAEMMKQSEQRLLDAIAKGQPKAEPAPVATATTVQGAKADLKAKIAELRKLEFIEPANLADALEPFIERISELEGKPDSTDAMVQKAVNDELLRRDALSKEQSSRAKQQAIERAKSLETFKQVLIADKPWLDETKADSLISKAESRFKKLFGGIEMTPEVAQERYNVIWTDELEAAEAASKTPTPPAPVTKRNDPKSTAGTQVVPSGASSARATAEPDTDPPMYVPD